LGAWVVWSTSPSCEVGFGRWSKKAYTVRLFLEWFGNGIYKVGVGVGVRMWFLGPLEVDVVEVGIKGFGAL